MLVVMIIDKKQWRLPKPISNRPEYDMEYYRTYLGNDCSGTDVRKFLANEKIYDRLSIMRKGEFPVQWKLRVKSTLQYLLSRNEYSIYHSFCLFAGFGEGKFDESYHSYYRPKIHKNNMAICFRCWKPFRVNDMMQGHWDQECSDPLSDLGRERVKQQAFDNYIFFAKI